MRGVDGDVDVEDAICRGPEAVYIPLVLLCLGDEPRIEVVWRVEAIESCFSSILHIK
jgi:hypothetical protein